MLASTRLELGDLRSARLGDWWAYWGAETRIQVGGQICLVGLAADVVSAEPVLARLERSYSCGGLDALIGYCDQLAGRFLVLVEKEDRLSVIPDGWAGLQAFWAVSPQRAIHLAEALESQSFFKGVPMNPHKRRSSFMQLAYVRSIGNFAQRRVLVPS